MRVSGGRLERAGTNVKCCSCPASYTSGVPCNIRCPWGTRPGHQSNRNPRCRRHRARNSRCNGCSHSMSHVPKPTRLRNRCRSRRSRQRSSQEAPQLPSGLERCRHRTRMHRRFRRLHWAIDCRRHRSSNQYRFQTDHFQMAHPRSPSCRCRTRAASMRASQSRMTPLPCCRSSCFRSSIHLKGKLHYIPIEPDSRWSGPGTHRGYPGIHMSRHYQCIFRGTLRHCNTPTTQASAQCTQILHRKRPGLHRVTHPAARHRMRHSQRRSSYPASCRSQMWRHRRIRCCPAVLCCWTESGRHSRRCT